MKKFILVAFLAIQSFYAHTQSLMIGDTIPDVVLHHLISYPSDKGHLKDFNKQNLILDFWNLNCGSCIDAFPFMAKMEEQFKGKLQVLLVNYESPAQVTKFFEDRKKAGLITSALPAVCSDSILSRLFLHEYNPHYAWIDKTGKVYGITGFEEMTEKNLDAFVRGVPSVLRQKTDSRIWFDEQKPFLIDNNGGTGKEMKFMSVLTGYIDKMSPICGVTIDSAGNRIFIANQDIRYLYQVAFDEGLYDGGKGQNGIPDNRTFFEVKDSTPYCGIVNGDEVHQNQYCYSLNVPRVSGYPEFKKMMRADLDRIFGLRPSIEKRKMTCLVLKSDDTSLVATKYKVPKRNIDYYSINFENIPVSILVFVLQYGFLPHQPFPIIDDTGIKGGIDLKLRADLKSPESLDRALKPFRMHFVKEDRVIDVLVLRDPISNNKNYPQQL